MCSLRTSYKKGTIFHSFWTWISTYLILSHSNQNAALILFPQDSAPSSKLQTAPGARTRPQFAVISKWSLIAAVSRNSSLASHVLVSRWRFFIWFHTNFLSSVSLISFFDGTLRAHSSSPQHVINQPICILLCSLLFACNSFCQTHTLKSLQLLVHALRLDICRSDEKDTLISRHIGQRLGNHAGAHLRMLHVRNCRT